MDFLRQLGRGIDERLRVNHSEISLYVLKISALTHSFSPTWAVALNFQMLFTLRATEAVSRS